MKKALKPLNSMENKIETLNEAIEAGVKIRATYAPNGEVVTVTEFPFGRPRTVIWSDGTEGQADINDLIDYTWDGKYLNH